MEKTRTRILQANNRFKSKLNYTKKKTKFSQRSQFPNKTDNTYQYKKRNNKIIHGKIKKNFIISQRKENPQDHWQQLKN